MVVSSIYVYIYIKLFSQSIKLKMVKKGIFLFCFFWSLGIAAQDSITLTPDKSISNLQDNWVYYEDKSHGLDWQQVIKLYKQDKFIITPSELSFVQLSKSAHWFLMKIHNPSKQTIRHTLVVDDPNIYQLDFFQLDTQNKLIRHDSDGTSIHPNKRSLGILSPAFIVELPAESSQLILVRFYSLNFLSTKAGLIPMNEYLQGHSIEYVFLGLFYGIVFLLLIYHGLLFIYTQEIAFIYLLIYHFLFGLATGFFDGLTGTYFYFIYPLTNFRPEMPILLGVIIFSHIALRSYVKTYQYLPFYDKVTKVFLVFTLSILGVYFYRSDWALWFLPYAIFFSFCIILLVSYKARKFYPVRASYFFGGFLFFSIFILVILFFLWKAIPTISNNTFVSVIYLGYIGQMMILSVGFAVEIRNLARRLITEEQEKQMILKNKNEELEKEINRRTQHLSTSTNQLKSVIESTNDVIYSIDREGVFLVANTSTIQRSKNIYNSEIEIGQNFFDKMPEYLRSIFGSLLEKVWQGEAVRKVEKIELDGTLIIQEISINPIFNEKEEVIGAAIFSKDITELVQKTESLAQTNANLRAILDNNDSAIWLVSHDFLLMDINYTAEQLYKYIAEKKPKIGENALSYLSSKDKTIWAERYNLVLKSGQPKLYIEHHNKGGIKLDFLVKIFPIQTDGKTTGLTVFLNNITEQHQAEKALQESQELLASINQHISEGIYRSNNNKVVYANKAFAELFGYSLEEVLQNRAITYYVDPNVRMELLKVLEKEVAYQNQEVRLKKKDGTEFWALISSTRYVDEKGEVFFDGVIRNISKLKEAEEELLTKNESLQKSNKELDKFVYSASHDLRAPLTSILGLIQILQDEEDEAIQKQYFGLMIKSVNRMDNFIRQIVDYSRNTRLKIKAEKINFEELITQVFASIDYLDPALSMNKTSSISQNHPFYTDVFRLEVILNNLVSNAVKYANPYQESSFVHVKVEVSEREAIIEVSDNGQGIEATYIDNIFEMFYKANTQNKGSGLGLYIVRETIEVIKGEVSVNSKFGEGTLFIVKIPSLRTLKNEDKLFIQSSEEE
jgi:PAS domain S-box-containing protein